MQRRVWDGRLANGYTANSRCQEEAARNAVDVTAIFKNISLIGNILLLDAKKFGEHIPDITDPNFVSIIKERLKMCRNVPVNKVASLVRTDLF